MHVCAIERLIILDQSAWLLIGNFLHGGLLRHLAQLQLLDKLSRLGCPEETSDPRRRSRDEQRSTRLEAKTSRIPEYPQAEGKVSKGH